MKWKSKFSADEDRLIIESTRGEHGLHRSRGICWRAMNRNRNIGFKRQCTLCGIVERSVFLQKFLLSPRCSTLCLSEAILTILAHQMVPNLSLLNYTNAGPDYLKYMTLNHLARGTVNTLSITQYVRENRRHSLLFCLKNTVYLIIY